MTETTKAEKVAKHVRKVSRNADVTRGEQSVLLAAAELIDRLSDSLDKVRQQAGAWKFESREKRWCGEEIEQILDAALGGDHRDHS